MNYESTHDIPNPSWGILARSYTYTPATAAQLNPILLKTRPDRIVMRYLLDYIALAGTFPCASNPEIYALDTDPILTRKTRTCPYKRQVTKITATQVYVGFVGPDWGVPGARVYFTISYVDGTHVNYEDTLDSNQYQPYYLSNVQLTCWDSPFISLLYPNVITTVPSGMEYSRSTAISISYLCQP